MTELPTSRPGRNERCPCGSGKKYKSCCLAKDAAADREARAAAAVPLPPPDPDAEPESEAPKRHIGRARNTGQPWKRAQRQSQAFQKRSGPRKRGAS